MRFCEKEDFSFPSLPSCMVYFLLLNEEVVYVGQTTKGIVRPLSHRDKKFDSIKVLFVEKEKLDEVEGYYIAKYKPKYNSKLTGYFRLFAARNKIRAETNEMSFTVANLRKKCIALDVEIIELHGMSYISAYDLERIIFALKEGE